MKLLLMIHFLKKCGLQRIASRSKDLDAFSWALKQSFKGLQKTRYEFFAGFRSFRSKGLRKIVFRSFLLAPKNKVYLNLIYYILNILNNYFNLFASRCEITAKNIVKVCNVMIELTC